MSVEEEIVFEISDTNNRRNIEFKMRSPSDGNKKDCAKIEGSKIEFLNTESGKGLFNQIRRMIIREKMIRNADNAFLLGITFRK